MKTKLISLLIALLCMTMLLVSCTDPCVEHIDADKDGICDIEGCEDAVKAVVVEPHDHKDENADNVCDVENCDTIILVNTVENVVEIIVPTKPEAKVDMVVKPIPVDVNRADYVEYNYAEKQAYINKLFRSVVSSDYDDGEGYLVIKKTSETLVPPSLDNSETPEDEYYEGKFKDTYVVSDLSGESEIVILTFVKEYEGNDDFVGFNLDDETFISVECEGEYLLYRAGVANTAPVLTLNRRDLDYGEGPVVIDEYVTYVYYYDGKIEVYDNATLAKLEEKLDDFFVDRPEFDLVNGNVGVIYDDESMQVYDLTKWIACDFVYEIPSYVEDSIAFELANGSILYQYIVELPDSAVSYDIYIDAKYDIVYEIVDPAAKTTTIVEFGYLIMDQTMADDEALEGYKFDGKNIFGVCSVENGMPGEAKILVTDDSLNVLYAIDKLVINQNGTGFELVADNYAKVSVLLGGYAVDAIVNLETGAITYLPAQIDRTFDTCYMIDTVLYNYDGSVKFDFTNTDKVEYKYFSGDTFFFVAKTEAVAVLDPVTGEPTDEFEFDYTTTKYYFYDLNKKDATLVEFDYDNVIFADDDAEIFVVKVETEVPNAETGANDIVVTYDVYNSDWALMATITDNIQDWNISGEYDEEAGLFLLNVVVIDEVEGNYSKVYLFGEATLAA